MIDYNLITLIIVIIGGVYTWRKSGASTISSLYSTVEKLNKRVSDLEKNARRKDDEIAALKDDLKIVIAEREQWRVSIHAPREGERPPEE